MSKLREGDVRVTLEYMVIVDEVFQLMNSKYPITWDSTDDGHGQPIGLRDNVDTSKDHSLISPKKNLRCECSVFGDNWSTSS